MQFTLEGLKAVEPSVIKILKEDLPIRISYKLSKLYDVVSKEMNRVEDMRQQLVKRYGEELDAGGMKVTEENLPAFNKEYGELMKETVGVDFESISVGQILDYSERLEMMGRSPISLSAFDIYQLIDIGLLKGE